jgi:hypothetical protein
MVNGEGPGDAPMTGWVAALEPGAPEVVAAWRSIELGHTEEVRRAVRAGIGPGSAGRIVAELGVLAGALAEAVARVPDALMSAPGGEADWTVAETAGHVADARAGLCLAASKAAAGSWPPDARPVVPGVPGPADADRSALLHRLERSQRIVARAGRTVAGHESDDCPLDHPWVGRLRCGEWLLFAGIHDLMHLEQLHDLLETSR